MSLSLRPTLFPTLLLSALLLAGGVGTELGVNAARRSVDAAIARETQTRLGELRARIESVLNGTLYLASGIEAQIRADKGTVRDASLNQTLLLLQQRNPLIRNIGIAPGNRIAYVQPLAGNEKALGLYYPENALQWPAIERVIKSRQPFLAGPIKLVQGGEGLIYRIPVFLDGDGRYWGLISTVIDADALWKSLALDGRGFSILGKDGTGASGAPVMGMPPPPGSVRYSTDIDVPGGKWSLMSTAQAEDIAPAPVALIRAAGWGTTLVLLMATLALLRSELRLRRLNITLAEARDAAEAGTRAKSSFLAMMSHEIRTPMNGILGMTQLLLRAGLPAQQADFARTAHQSAAALLVILDDILDYSKIEAGHLAIEEVEFKLLELLEDIADLFAARAASKGVDFIAILDPHLPPSVYGDPTRLRQILNNLLSNAVKFTAQGRVLLSARRAPAPSGQIEFSVRDSGLGIDAEAQKCLFSPFTQADSTHSRRFGGTGLGLSISQRLAQIMGSHIHIESQAGMGSCFSFSLTLRPASLRAGSQLHAKPLDCSPPPQVLFVCEQREFTEAILPWLRELGTAALHTNSADATCRALLERPPALLILDDKLPERQRVFHAMLNQATLRDCKLLRLCAPDQDDSAPPYAGERNSTLNKPVRPSALARRLSEMLIGPSTLASRPSPTPSTPHYGRILLVEDNSINRKVALAMLAPLGVEVLCAENGAEALDRLSDECFDLILMDMQMPVMDGTQATAAIRDPASSVRQHDIPIIALTANAFAEHRDACLAVGMNDFLAKPIAVDALRAMLVRYLPPFTQT